MSDQATSGQSEVTAGDIIRDGWMWVKGNKKPLALFGLAIIAFVIISPLVFVGIASQFATKGQTTIEPSGFFFVLMILLSFAFFLSFLWFIAWIFQSVLGIRSPDKAAIKARYGPLKIALRSLIFTVVISLPIAIALFILLNVVMSGSDGQALLTLFSSISAILVLGAVSLTLTAAYTSYLIPYLIGSVVKGSPRLFASLSISHQHFKVLFKTVFIISLLPFCLGLPEQVIQASRMQEFIQNPDAGVPIVETSSFMIIVSTVLDLIQFAWFFFGCICSAIAYKKIVGLPELPTGTDAQTMPPS